MDNLTTKDKTLLITSAADVSSYTFLLLSETFCVCMKINAIKFTQKSLKTSEEVSAAAAAAATTDRKTRMRHVHIKPIFTHHENR